MSENPFHKSLISLIVDSSPGGLLLMARAAELFAEDCYFNNLVAGMKTAGQADFFDDDFVEILSHYERATLSCIEAVSKFREDGHFETLEAFLQETTQEARLSLLRLQEWARLSSEQQ